MPASPSQRLYIEDITIVLCSRRLNDLDMYSIPRSVLNLSQTWQFSSLEGEEGIERRGPTVCRMMSENVACLALLYLHPVDLLTKENAFLVAAFTNMV